MFYQIFLSPQAKRWAIISYKHGIYDLPNELPNDLILRKLGNIRRMSKLHRMIAQCPAPHPAEIQISLALTKAPRKITIELLPRYAISHEN